MCLNELKLGFIYCTHAIITYGQYTFYPLFEVHLCTVTFGLMDGQYSRVVSNQEWVIVVRIRYFNVMLIMQQNNMEKGFKSCKDVLLRADLFWQEGLGWPCPEKDTRIGFFHNIKLHYQHHIQKNLRPILPRFWISTRLPSHRFLDLPTDLKFIMSRFSVASAGLRGTP